MNNDHQRIVGEPPTRPGDRFFVPTPEFGSDRVEPSVPPEADPRVAGRGRLVKAFDQADELRARIADGNDLNRPPRLPRHQIDGIHVALRRVDGGHADNGRLGAVRSIHAPPNLSSPLPFGCPHDQMSPVLVLGIDLSLSIPRP
jgi:hypothetical protein